MLQVTVKVSARIGATFPMCFVKATILIVDPLIPLQ